MLPEPGDVPPDRSDPWRITHVGRRVRWESGEAECETCRRPVRMDRRHYYVTVSPEADRTTRRATDEEVVFCTETCAARWTAEA